MYLYCGLIIFFIISPVLAFLISLLIQQIEISGNDDYFSFVLIYYKYIYSTEMISSFDLNVFYNNQSLLPHSILLSFELFFSLH